MVSTLSIVTYFANTLLCHTVLLHVKHLIWPNFAELSWLHPLNHFKPCYVILLYYPILCGCVLAFESYNLFWVIVYKNLLWSTCFQILQLFWNEVSGLLISEDILQLQTNSVIGSYNEFDSLLSWIRGTDFNDIKYSYGTRNYCL